VLDIHPELPWEPISVIGIAVAFYLGFKNNSSYDRTWEARKIWGGIVNNSRSFGAQVVSFVHGDDAVAIRKELIYRHTAWITALRYQLRLPREWEHTEDRVSKLYSPSVVEMNSELDKELCKYLPHDEIVGYLKQSNVATQILATQSKRLQELRDKGIYEDFRHMELVRLIVSFYDGQGASERIKNFPFPRQYASTALWLTVVFCGLLPFGIIDVFHEFSGFMFWICPFMVGLITWIFFLMEKIGDYSENPFEGTYNDVPITTISRGIEIDLREMINDTDIPKPIAPENGFSL
jgi:putative membrane protein